MLFSKHSMLLEYSFLLKKPMPERNQPMEVRGTAPTRVSNHSSAAFCEEAEGWALLAMAAGLRCVLGRGVEGGARLQAVLD